MKIWLHKTAAAMNSYEQLCLRISTKCTHIRSRDKLRYLAKNTCTSQRQSQPSHGRKAFISLCKRQQNRYELPCCRDGGTPDAVKVGNSVKNTRLTHGATDRELHNLRLHGWVFTAERPH